MSNKSNAHKWTIVDKNAPVIQAKSGKWTITDKNKEDKFYFAGNLSKLKESNRY